MAAKKAAKKTTKKAAPKAEPDMGRELWDKQAPSRIDKDADGVAPDAA